MNSSDLSSVERIAISRWNFVCAVLVNVVNQATGILLPTVVLTGGVAFIVLDVVAGRLPTSCVSVRTAG